MEIIDLVALGMLIGLILIGGAPLKAQRILYGIIVLIFGLIPLIEYMGIISLVERLGPYWNLIRFATIFTVMIVGQTLFVEGLKEQNTFLKIISMVFGIVIILATMLPWMQEYNAISFVLPSYTPIIDFIIYIISGGLILIGAFKAGSV